MTRDNVRDNERDSAGSRSLLPSLSNHNSLTPGLTLQSLLLDETDALPPVDVEEEQVPLLAFCEDVGPFNDDDTDVPADAPRLVVDLQRVIDDCLGFLITGSSGSGKSHAVRGLLEQTHGRVQQIIVDTEGEYVTLREHFDYLVAAKSGGDIPLSPHTAAILCRRVMELGVSCILDIYELSPRARQEYVAAFLGELLETPAQHRRPVFVAIPEVHLYAPQGPNTPAKEAVRDLVARGRKRGIMPIFDTQSVAKTDKTALEAIRNKLVGYIELDVHLDRAAAELGLRGEDKEQLRQLPRGMFFAQGPALSREVTVVRTGQNLTHAPKMGVRSHDSDPNEARSTALPTPAAIREILSLFADLPEQADDEFKTIAQARRQIAELEAKLAAASVADVETRVERVEIPVEVLVEVPVEVIIEVPFEVTVEVPVLGDFDRQHVSELAAALLRATQDLVILAKDLHNTGAELNARLARWDTGEQTGDKRATASPRESPLPELSVTQIPLSAPRQRILDVLASFAALGITDPARSNVAVCADASPKSSSFANNLSALRTGGFVEYPSGSTASLTSKGSAAADPAAHRPITHASLLSAWQKRISVPQASVLAHIAAQKGQPAIRAEIAGATGVSPTSSSFTNNLSALKALGLISYPSGSTVAATSLLFPVGLRGTARKRKLNGAG